MRIRSKLLASLLVGIVSLFTTQSQSASETDPSSIEAFVRERSLAEQWARRVKERYQPGDRLYRTADVLYGNAQSSANALLTRLVLQLELGKSIQDDKEIADSVSNCVTQAEVFVMFARSAYLGEAQPMTSPQSLADGLAPLLTAVTNAAVDVWKQYTAANQTRRDEIKKQLNAMMWKDFREI